MIKCCWWFLFSILSLFSTANGQETTSDDNTPVAHHDPEDTCHEFLIDKSNKLTLDQFQTICQIWTTYYDLFIIRIRTESDYSIQGAVFFEASSFKYFEEECPKHSQMCQFGFLLDIYAEDKIIIIQPGSKAKIWVNDIFRKRAIASVRTDWLRDHWHKAWTKILSWWVYKENGGKTKFPAPISKDPNNFWFYILVPFISVGFIGMTLLLFYMSKGYFNKDCFQYFDKVIELYRMIVANKDKKIWLEPYICIFCWKKTSNKREIFMYCNHSYHEKCLRKWRWYQYSCCPCSYEAIKEIEDNKNNKNQDAYLQLEDLKILLGLCLDAFRKENLYDYFVEREAEIEEFNNKYNETWEELCWLYQNKVHNYKNYRIFYKMYKVWKMSCFILAFYPSFLKSKKVKLLTKLLQVKQRGATVEKIR